MKKNYDILRMALISPELCFLLAVVLVYQLWPDVLSFAGQPFKEKGDVWKYLPTLPILFTGIVFKGGEKIRAPLDNAMNKILYEWPFYNFLRNRVLFSFFICIFCSISAISLWIFIDSLKPSIVGAIYISATGISGLTALCIILALPSLKEILCKYTK